MTYYVTMTDKFMSGWGPARNKTNKLVIECDNYDEAVIVERNAQRRPEMKYINICSTKPHYRASSSHISWHDKTDYSSWFTPQIEWSR